MKKYSYSAEDNSILTPFIYKYFVNPLIKVLPLAVPANIITLLSNSFVVIAFMIAYMNYINKTHSYLYLIPILCFAYIVGDCSDGIQARRTKTSSPLGEYFDHFLDSFVTGLLTGILMLTFRESNPIILFCTYQFLYIGQIGAFWERLHTRVMKFGKFSTSEGIMAITVMAALYSLEFIRSLNAKAFIVGFSIPQLIIFAGFLASGIAGLCSIIESKHFSFRLFLHIAFSSLIGLILIVFVHSSILFLTLIIMLYNVFFIESLLSATNEQTKESFPDFIVPISCIFYFVCTQHIFFLQVIQLLYLSLRVIIRFSLFFSHYKEFWFWINPKIDE